MNTEFELRPSLKVGREEQDWIVANLSAFFDDGLIADVLYRVKGGKEANVYCCAGGPSAGTELLAAKVYRPHTHRTMRNDWMYRLGRETIDASGKTIRDGRSLRAIRKRTRHGRALLRGSWIAHEYATLQSLRQAGLDVPTPLEMCGDTILMEYLGDAIGAAPALHEITLPPAEATALFRRLILNVERMLEARVIHADLSAYNVLYWRGEVRLIDFPQAVDPLANPNAYFLLDRDVDRLCRYFRRFGVPANAGAITAELWRRMLSRGLGNDAAYPLTDWQ